LKKKGINKLLSLLLFVIFHRLLLSTDVLLTRFVVIDIQFNEENKECNIDNTRPDDAVIRISLVDETMSTVSRTKKHGIVDHDSHAEDELDDLDLGDVLLPPDGATKSSDGVVVVHGSVDEHVCPGADCTVGTVVDVEEPGKRKSDHVVVDVKEAQTVLSKHEEDGIDKFPHLADEEAEENPRIETGEEGVFPIANHLVEGCVGSIKEDT